MFCTFKTSGKYFCLFYTVLYCSIFQSDVIVALTHSLKRSGLHGACFAAAIKKTPRLLTFAWRARSAEEDPTAWVRREDAVQIPNLGAALAIMFNTL